MERDSELEKLISFLEKSLQLATQLNLDLPIFLLKITVVEVLERSVEEIAIGDLQDQLAEAFPDLCSKPRELTNWAVSDRVYTGAAALNCGTDPALTSRSTRD